MGLKTEIREGIACDSVGHPHSIAGRAICLSVHPGKMLLYPFIAWFRRHYAGKYKYAKAMFGFDMVLLGIALTLAIVALIVWFNPPMRFEDHILFEASVAPREIISGAPSTLVIRYTNKSTEDLRDARLRLTYPAHFLLQSLTTDQAEIEDSEMALGTIPAGGTGTIHVRGVMFGDVGGEQKFQSQLTFVHGTEKPLTSTKISDHIFSPSRSTLALTLKLPERLLAFQDVKGIISYENRGTIDVPVVTIKPEWPEGFTTTSRNLVVPSVAAGKSGEISFTGYLGDVPNELTWTFHPSFTFGEDLYKQESLVQVTPVVAAPIKLSHSAENNALQPGATATFHLTYEHVGDFPVSELVLGIESTSPFFPKDEFLLTKSIKHVQPGDHGTVDIQVPLRSTIRQSETTTYEDLTLATRALAQYTMGDGSGQRVTSKGSSLESPLTTPLVFDSFARYFTTSGDQIGRGPLPPRVDRPTSFWVFWNVQGTTNAIENIVIEGTLPANVEFTGRESSSQNGGVSYDKTTRKIRWTSDRLTPTLSPTSKIVGVAFELEITPLESQTGAFPTLLNNITFTAKDANTGAFLARTHKDLTTSLPNDDFAKENGVVY